MITGVNDPRSADELGLMRFSYAMNVKLAKKRGEGKHGWNYPIPKDRTRPYFGCTVDDLKSMLRKHVKKGDMVDVGNIAMMIWNRQNPRGLKR